MGWGRGGRGRSGWGRGKGDRGEDGAAEEKKAHYFEVPRKKLTTAIISKPSLPKSNIAPWTERVAIWCYFGGWLLRRCFANFWGKCPDVSSRCRCLTSDQYEQLRFQWFRLAGKHAEIFANLTYYADHPNMYILSPQIGKIWKSSRPNIWWIAQFSGSRWTQWVNCSFNRLAYDCTSDLCPSLSEMDQTWSGRYSARSAFLQLSHLKTTCISKINMLQLIGYLNTLFILIAALLVTRVVPPMVSWDYISSWNGSTYWWIRPTFQCCLSMGRCSIQAVQNIILELQLLQLSLPRYGWIRLN